jgi:hypothetical protein
VDKPENENYCATVVKIPVLVPLEGADRLLGVPLFGFQALVDLNHSVGELGIVFPAECQLSEEYARMNNLHAHGNLNDNPEAKGYLQDNRRVRAIKLRGHRSDCLFMPLESLAYTGYDLSELKEGMSFDRLGGHDICRKYVIKTKGPSTHVPQPKAFKRVDPHLFVEHFDTANYFRNQDKIAPDEHIYVTTKLHGTSVRLGNTSVLRKLKWRDAFAEKIGVKVSKREWDLVAGSRKVIKDPRNPGQAHYYSSDIWTSYLEKLEGLIPEGFLLFGEIIGYTPDGAAIQKDYTYSLLPGTRELYVYRVAVVNPRGVVVDLSWPAVKEFCAARGIKHVPELWSGPHCMFKAEDWLDSRFHDEGHDSPNLGPNKKLVDEGVCIRAERLVPYITKAKSPIFTSHETKLLDEGLEDLESAESYEEAA